MADDVCVPVLPTQRQAPGLSGILGYYPLLDSMETTLAARLEQYHYALTALVGHAINLFLNLNSLRITPSQPAHYWWSCPAPVWFRNVKDIPSARRQKLSAEALHKYPPVDLCLFEIYSPGEMCHGSTAPILSQKKPRGSPAPTRARTPQARFGIETKICDHRTDIICFSRIVGMILRGNLLFNESPRTVETRGKNDLSVFVLFLVRALASLRHAKPRARQISRMPCERQGNRERLRTQYSILKASLSERT